jgi:hypothetical protein
MLIADLERFGGKNIRLVNFYQADKNLLNPEAGTKSLVGTI